MRMLLSGHGMVRLLPVLSHDPVLALGPPLPHGAAAMPANATGIAPATPAQYAFLRLFQRSEPEPVRGPTEPDASGKAGLRRRRCGPDPDAEEAASTRIAVFGDSLATNLGQGLLGADGGEEEGAEIAVSVQARGSSGLVRDDFFDWPANLARILADAPDFDIAVLPIGPERSSAAQGRSGAERRPLSDPCARGNGSHRCHRAGLCRCRDSPLDLGRPAAHARAAGSSTDLAMIN